MHALVINVGIEPGREDEGVEYVEANVIPQMRQLPGLIAGYWLAARDGKGLTLLVFEDEQSAQNTAKGLAEVPTAQFASVGNVDIRAVVANI